MKTATTLLILAAIFGAADPPSEIGTIMDWAQALGFGGILMWLLFKSIPKEREEERKSRAEQSAAFLDALHDERLERTTERAQFLKALSDEREAQKANDAATAERHKAMMAEQRDQLRELFTLLAREIVGLKKDGG